jgi:adhesin/invasin
VKGTAAGTATITVKLGGVAFAVTPATVTLTAGAPSATKSTLVASPASIVADGSTLSTLTLTLKDANNNPVAGQSVTFVSDLTGTSVGGVTSGGGTYTSNVSGTAAGTATITVKLGGVAFAVTPATVTLTAGAPSATTSTLVASPTSIVADGSTLSTLTLTLKDANNNPVAGQSATFTSTLAGTTVWTVTDHGDGTYTAYLTGTAEGTATITVKLGGVAFAVTPATVTLTAVPPTTLDVNGKTFSLSAGFPTTGFAYAKFQVLIHGAVNNNLKYNWTVDQSWVSVDASGNVTFTGAATTATKAVTITATPKTVGTPFTYTFTVNKWFTSNGTTTMNWSDASSLCTGQGALPTQLDMSNAPGTGSRGTRAVGALWSEWGAVNNYPGSGLVSGSYWSSDRYAIDYYLLVSMVNGAVEGSPSSNNFNVSCRKDL